MVVSRLFERFVRTWRAYPFVSSHVIPHTRNSTPLKILLLGLGLGLSASTSHALLTENKDTCGWHAQCEAPILSSNNPSEETHTPLDHEHNGYFKKGPVTYSCASYRANSPIEDRYEVVQDAETGEVFAIVLDGHGSWQVAEYAKNHLIQNVQSQLNQHSKDPKVDESLKAGFLETDQQIMDQIRAAFKLGYGQVARTGSCALLAFVQENAITVANAGDCRCVLGQVSSSGDEFTAVPLSNDHNAMSEIEQAKLIKEHPGEEDVFVCRHKRSCYVKSSLQPTRAFGDFCLKYAEFNGPPYVNGDRSKGRHIKEPYSPPYITAEPEIISKPVVKEDKFLIMGTDGVWDFLTNEEAVEIVGKQMEAGNQMGAGRAIVEAVLEKAATKFGMTYEELLEVEPGRNRRRKHDDTTAVVLFL